MTHPLTRSEIEAQWNEAFGPTSREGLVPYVPVTLNMLNHAEALGCDLHGEQYAAIYRAMAAVAPKPPSLVWTKDPANGVMTPHYPERARIAELEAELQDARDDGRSSGTQLEQVIREKSEQGRVLSLRIAALEAETAHLVEENERLGHGMDERAECARQMFAAKDARIAELDNERWQAALRITELRQTIDYLLGCNARHIEEKDALQAQLAAFTVANVAPAAEPKPNPFREFPTHHRRMGPV